MPRRARVVKREVPPDPRFGSRTLTRFMNKLMLNGKKSLAERIVYRAMESIERTARRSPIDVFDTALRNATPLLEVKPRRVGGATYQVPVEIKGDRKQSLAMRWLIAAARLTLAGSKTASRVGQSTERRLPRLPQGSRLHAAADRKVSRDISGLLLKQQAIGL